MTDTATLRFSFCNKSQDEVRKLIQGTSALICDECVDLCNDITFGPSPVPAASARDGVTGILVAPAAANQTKGRNLKVGHDRRDSLV